MSNSFALAELDFYFGPTKQTRFSAKLTEVLQ